LINSHENTWILKALISGNDQKQIQEILLERWSLFPEKSEGRSQNLLKANYLGPGQNSLVFILYKESRLFDTCFPGVLLKERSNIDEVLSPIKYVKV